MSIFCHARHKTIFTPSVESSKVKCSFHLNSMGVLGCSDLMLGSQAALLTEGGATKGSLLTLQVIAVSVALQVTLLSCRLLLKV
jgi:hypothetical protein